MRTSGPAFWEELQICAGACQGDTKALHQVAESEAFTERALALGLGPSLALAADGVDLEHPSTRRWRDALRASAVGWLMVEEAATAVRRGLHRSVALWAPFKGCDVGPRAFGIREQRPTSDVDLLVDPDDFDGVRRDLESVGWRSVTSSERREKYLRQEGYAWQATGPAGALLEVHFRLWGLVPSGIVTEMLRQAIPDPMLGPSGRRLSRTHAYLVAAVHAWTNPRPRRLLDWMDLSRLARDSGENLATEIVRASRRWSLELPVCLSAVVADRLWPGEVHRRVAEELLACLHSAEKRAYGWVGEQGFDAISYEEVVLARLLSGRPSRMGWRSVWRRVWEHPGMVEEQTPDRWWWPRRRWSSVVGALNRVLR